MVGGGFGRGSMGWILAMLDLAGRRQKDGHEIRIWDALADIVRCVRSSVLCLWERGRDGGASHARGAGVQIEGQMALLRDVGWGMDYVWVR
jgi:hypothetical protein